jgi:hypothetical protein
MGMAASVIEELHLFPAVPGCDLAYASKREPAELCHFAGTMLAGIALS